MKIEISEIKRNSITVSWEAVEGADRYALFWGDKDSPTFVCEKIYEGNDCSYTENISTHIPYYFYAESYKDGEVLERSEKIRSEAAYRLDPQLEKLNRGLVAINTGEGIFVAWRMFRDEAKGAVKERLTGTDYILYRKRPGEEEREVALVTDSTNYLDKDGREGDSYCVAPVRAASVTDETDMGCKVETDTVSKTEADEVRNAEIGEKSEYAEVIKDGKNYLGISFRMDSILISIKSV